MSYVGTSAAGNLVTAKGTGIPASFLPPGSLSGLSGILLGNNLSAFTAVALINNGTFITSNAGVPSFLTNGTTGQVLTATAGSPPTWANPTTSGTVTSVSGTANQVAVATGTTTPVISLIGPYTPSTFTTNGILFGNGITSIGVTAQGAANTVLLGNGGVPSFGAVPNAALANSSVTLSNGNNITVTGSPLSLGGTASFNLTGTTTNAVQLGNASGSLTSLGLVNNGVLISGTTGIPSWLVDGTTGQVLTATAGSPPTWANPTTSVGIWTDEATSFSAVAGNGYFITAASVVATLPASPTQGQTIAFASDSATASSLTITASAGQVIRLGTTASAAAGTAVNTQRGDSITLVYRTSDTTWIATQAIGSWNVT
jgi:hypothetical protein